MDVPVIKRQQNKHWKKYEATNVLFKLAFLFVIPGGLIIPKQVCQQNYCIYMTRKVEKGVLNIMHGRNILHVVTMCVALPSKLHR